MGKENHIILAASGITKSFHRLPILSDVELILEKGETVGLIGPNGAGKTTLLKILSGIVRPDRGQGLLNNKKLFTDDPVYRAYLIFWGHQALAYPAFTGVENIRFFLELRGEEIVNDLILAAFSKYGLNGHADVPIRNYSAGMLQRLSMIRLALAPWSLALLDEPTSGLDVKGMQLLNQLVEDWHSDQRTIFFTSHDAEWTAEQCDRVLVLKQGKIQQSLKKPSAADIKSIMVEQQ